MRTTINIDDDVLAAVKQLAHSRSESVGVVVSELVRKGIHPPGFRYESSVKNGPPVFKVSENAKILTTEDVKSAEDEA